MNAQARNIKIITTGGTVNTTTFVLRGRQIKHRTGKIRTDLTTLDCDQASHQLSSDSDCEVAKF